MSAIPAATYYADTVPVTHVDRWFVLRTKSRQEKVLAKELNSGGIDHFLPLITCVKYYGGHRANVETPLFPGYVFLKGSRDEAFFADRTRRVAQIIEVSDQRRLSWELQNLQLVLQKSNSLDPFPYLQKGVRVEVSAGPFRGLQGIIEERGRRDRLILQVDILSRAVSLEIDASLLDVIRD